MDRISLDRGRHTYAPGVYSKLERWLWQLTVFLIPTNLAYHWITDESYVRGLVVDYLVPRLYLTDVVIIGLLGVALFRGGWPRAVAGWLRASASRTLFLVLTLIYLPVVSLMSPAPVASLYGVVTLVKLSLLLSYVLWRWSYREILEATWRPMVLSVIFQCGIGLYQYVEQSSLFGYFLLGEPTLVPHAAVAQTVRAGDLKMLAYGTTPHPHVLAGFVGLTMVTWWLAVRESGAVVGKKWHVYITSNILTGLSLATIFITDSLTTFIALTSVIILYFAISKRFILLLLSLLAAIISFMYLLIGTVYQHSYVMFDTLSISRRYELFSASFDIFRDHPLVGTGLNTFTKVLTDYAGPYRALTYVQPVHMVYVLALVEFGVLGIVMLTWSMWISLGRLVVKQRDWIRWLPLAYIGIVGLIDHYPLTLLQGQLMSVLALLYALADMRRQSPST